MRNYGRQKLQDVNFFHFFDKRPLTVKFSKLCSKSFHCDTDRRVVLKFGQREIGKIVPCLPDKNNFAWLQRSLLHGSVHFWQSYSRCKVNAIFG